MIEITFTPSQNNWLGVTWTDVVQAPDVVTPATPVELDGEGNVIKEAQPERTEPGQITRTSLKHVSYHPTQLALLQADADVLGTPLTDHMAMLNEWVAGYVPPVPDITVLKAAKNLQINQWRATANKTHFPHGGKLIACDDLSRGDIDAVANSIALTGAFPAGFPGAWKATDNSYIMLSDVDAFKAMHAAMTAQGTANFMHAQTLKTALAAATTEEQINAIVWD